MLAADRQSALAERDAEIRQLRRDYAHLRLEHAEVLDLLGVANARIAELAATVGQLVQEAAKSNDRIAELLVIARRKKRATTPDKSAPPPQPPPTVTEDVAKAFSERPTPPDAPGVLNDRPRPRPCPTGRKPLPAHLPVVGATVYPDACTCGCSSFDLVDEVVEEKLDVAAHQRKRRTVRKTGRCRACGKRTTAQAPPSPFPRSKVTCEWLAWFLVQKFLMLAPLDRIRRHLRSMGIALSESFLVSQVERAADILDAIDGEHWKDLVAGDSMATDGTGLEVQIKGVGLHHGYIEVYHRDDVVVYQYEAEKGGETQADKLAKFNGDLLVDAESRYNEAMRRNPNIFEANCNAHPRRKLRDAEVAQPQLAAEGGRFVSAWFEAEAEAKALKLSSAELLAWRQERIKPLTVQFRDWMEAVRPTLVPSDPLAKVIQYYRNHWTPLMRFLNNPKISIDNSGSERLFQAVAKIRLNSLFAGGPEGAHRATVLLGIAATCARLGVDFGAYLTWVFIRRGTHKHLYPMKATELTPAAYRRANPPQLA